MAPSNKVSRTLSLIAAILVLAAAGLSFLGLVTVKGNSGPIAIPTVTLLGGGEVLVDEPLGNTALYFAINIPLLITAQVFLLSFLACLLSVGSRKTGIIAAILLFSSLILSALSIPFVSWVNPAIPARSVGLALGYYLLVGCMTLAFVFELLAVVFVRVKKQ